MLIDNQIYKFLYINLVIKKYIIIAQTTFCNIQLFLHNKITKYSQQIKHMQKPNIFHQHTNTFRLKASLIDCKMSLQLYDMKNWIYYLKQYTQSNIGKQIHRKLDLQDLLYSLQQSNESDQQKMSQSQSIKSYQFGNIIANGQIPCYKIQQFGKITIYSIIYQRKNNSKQIKYESVLQLNKIRTMTEQQIKKQKQLLDNIASQKLINKLSIKYQEIIQENKCLYVDIKQLKKQLKQVKQQLKIAGMKFERSQQKIQDIYREMEKQRSYNKEYFLRQQQKIQKLTKLITQKSQNKQFIVESKIKEENKGIFELPQATISKFKIQNYQVIFGGPNGNWTQYIFNSKVPYDKTYTFKIKIFKSPKQGIFIGVVDYERQKQSINSQNSGNSICYYSYGNNGQIFYPQKNQGVGYKQGQTVQVQVSLFDRKIRWLVGQQQRAEHTSDILGDKTRIFMPFIQMSYNGDIMEWIC